MCISDTQPTDLPVDRADLLWAEYEILERKVALHSQRMFRVFWGLGAGGALIVWNSQTTPDAAKALALLAMILMHCALASLIHSHFTILVAKRTMCAIAVFLGRAASNPIMIWESRVWSGLWGGVERRPTSLAWVVGGPLVLALVGVYWVLLPESARFVQETLLSDVPCAGVLYSVFMIVVVVVEFALAWFFVPRRLRRAFADLPGVTAPER